MLNTKSITFCVQGAELQGYKCWNIKTSENEVAKQSLSGRYEQ